MPGSGVFEKPHDLVGPAPAGASAEAQNGFVEGVLVPPDDGHRGGLASDGPPQPSHAAVAAIHESVMSAKPCDCAGEVYCRSPRRTDQSATAQQDAALAEGARPTGTMRLAMPHVSGRRFAAPIVADFTSRHPEVAIEIVLGNERFRLLGAGVDLAVGIGPQPDVDPLDARLARHHEKSG